MPKKSVLRLSVSLIIAALMAVSSYLHKVIISLESEPCPTASRPKVKAYPAYHFASWHKFAFASLSFIKYYLSQCFTKFAMFDFYILTSGWSLFSSRTQSWPVVERSLYRVTILLRQVTKSCIHFGYPPNSSFPVTWNAIIPFRPQSIITFRR